MSYSFNMSELEINKSKVLGAGAFAKVYYGEYYKSPVAVKTLHELRLEERDKRLFRKEIQILM